MNKATKKGVSRQLGVKVVEISNKYSVFLGPADGDVEQFGPSILRASSLGEHTDVPLAKTIRHVDNHRGLLISLIAMHGSNDYAAPTCQPLQYVPLSRERGANSQVSLITGNVRRSGAKTG